MIRAVILAAVGLAAFALRRRRETPSSTVVDITERKLAEEARRASEERYRTLFEYAPDGILIADPESYYIDANASICRMLGYARDELIGCTPRTSLRRRRSAYRAGLEAITGESDITGNGSSGARTVRSFRRSHRDGCPTATSWPMIRDITERKLPDSALKESNSRFQENWRTSTWPQ